ncbi:P-loop containing nucleoside triphosphate hydrolase protein, partial [Mycena epipterygia]
EAELNHLTDALLGGSARAAIMGPGRMGKSTLAMTVLHHPAVTERYPNRHFVSCESAYTSIDLVSAVGSHLGLERTRQLSQAIVRHLSQCGTSLLVLDNLETPWEPLESRAQVEEFISLLADIPNMALLITMRGAERPGKVKWTRPFLPVLEPLSPSASCQIFAAVADEPSAEDKPALDELLDLSGNLPLAISLLANIASFEGYQHTLSRWKVENTTLLSDGHDKHSNLEISIIMSLGSPRISSSPHAKDLLSLLSLLPDGITQEDLVTSKVPSPHIADCKSSLIRTSLAYMDNNARIKILSPIRKYMKQVHPP